jgi:hypothetical protein
MGRQIQESIVLKIKHDPPFENYDRQSLIRRRIANKGTDISARPFKETAVSVSGVQA